MVRSPSHRSWMGSGGPPVGTQGPPGHPAGVSRPSWRVRRVLESLGVGWERSDGAPADLGGVVRPTRRSVRPTRGPGVVGRPTHRSGKPTRRSERGRRGSLGGPGGVERSSQWAGRCWEALTEVWEGLEVPLGGQNWSGGPPGGSGGVKSPSLWADRLWVALRRSGRG